MSKSNTNKTATSKFYKEPAMEEVYTGYLHKSPAQSALLKTFKSWKRRFFVLSKTGEDAYHLTYYTNNEKRDKPVGEIDIFKITLMYTGLEAHQMWDWIQKNFNCPPASVLFLRVKDNTHKHREYFLIGENSDDMDGWHNALDKAPKRDNRFRSISTPVNCPEPKFEDQSDKNCTTTRHYDYPRKFSEPLVPVERKISVKEDEDENDGKQDESPKDSEYMHMASVQMALEDVQQETDTASIQTNTSINGLESSVCNGAVNQDKDDENKGLSTDETRHSLPRLLNFNGNCASPELDEAPLNKSETHTHVEKEICISQNSLKNSLILTQEEGKPCVSECRQIQDSRLFHKGDQILALNDLLTDTVEEIHTYLKRLSKDKVKLTIRRFPGSQPLDSEPFTSY